MNNENADKSPPRHWHGDFGNRYEHHNVWVRGGQSSAYRRPSTGASDAFATNTERRASSTSDTSANTNERSPPSVSERRRSSGHGPSTLFESLTNQKRSPYDEAFAERRKSWNEQATPGGFFAKWWSGYTGGTK